MTRLENVSVEELEAALAEATEKRETQRLMVAIIYKRGPSAPTIAAWLDTREQTIYRWFDRLETEPIAQAVQDRQRSGRPPKLDDADRDEFHEAVQNPPTEAGYDHPAWTTELAQQFLEDEFDTEYSRRHVQRLLKDAGLTWQTPRPHRRRLTRTNAPNSGKPSKKLSNSLPNEYTTIAVDQTRKTIGCDLYRSWFPCGERVTLPFWRRSKSVKLLGAVTDEREFFATEVADRFTSDVTIRLLRALQDEFGGKIHVLLDNASYFKPQQMHDFIEETQIEVTYFPRGSPDLNPVEECWRQLKRSLGNRFFGSVDEFRPAVTIAIDQINPPQITDYLRRSV